MRICSTNPLLRWPWAQLLRLTLTYQLQTTTIANIRTKRWPSARTVSAMKWPGSWEEPTIWTITVWSPRVINLRSRIPRSASPSRPASISSALSKSKDHLSLKIIRQPSAQTFSAAAKRTLRWLWQWKWWKRRRPGLGQMSLRTISRATSPAQDSSSTTLTPATTYSSLEHHLCLSSRVCDQVGSMRNPTDLSLTGPRKHNSREYRNSITKKIF